MPETVHIAVPIATATPPFVNVMDGSLHPKGGGIYNDSSTIAIELVFVGTAAAATPVALRGIPIPPKQFFPVGALVAGEYFHVRLPPGSNAVANSVRVIVFR
jgi:hypothetical protein